MGERPTGARGVGVPLERELLEFPAALFVVDVLHSANGVLANNLFRMMFHPAKEQDKTDEDDSAAEDDGNEASDFQNTLPVRLSRSWVVVSDGVWWEFRSWWLWRYASHITI